MKRSETLLLPYFVWIEPHQSWTRASGLQSAMVAESEPASTPATLLQRVWAFALDYLIICGYLILLGIVTSVVLTYVGWGVLSGFFASPLRADLLAFLTSVFPVALYFAVTESSSRQASWGKRRRGLRVVSANGGRVSFLRALSRSLLKLLPWQLAHTCLFHIPGWPVSPGTPPTWVMVGLVLVWVLVALFAISVAATDRRDAIYDRLLGIRVLADPG